MNLYLVERHDIGRWDTFDSFIVCCNTEQEARETYPNNSGDTSWITDKPTQYMPWVRGDEIDLLRVTMIGVASPDTKKGVVLASYNAG